MSKSRGLFNIDVSREDEHNHEVVIRDCFMNCAVCFHIHPKHNIACSFIFFLILSGFLFLSNFFVS